MHINMHIKKSRQRFAAVVIIIWGCIFCPTGSGVDFNYRLASDPPTLDPALSTDTTSGAVVLKIFDGLVQFDPETLDVIPAVAERYDILDGGKTYVFYLRRDVRFHNGRYVTASDVQFSFERTLNPKTKSPRTWVLTPIQGSGDYIQGKTDHLRGIEIIDDWTLKLSLDHPFAPFLAQLCMEAASIVPREECEKWGADFKSHPVGCGPFEFVKWAHDVNIILKKNPFYYAGAPFIDKVTFHVIPSVSTAFEEYKSGGLDMLDQIPQGQIMRLRKLLPDDLKIWPFLSIYYIGFNLSKPPFKDNKYLRQAINCAIDKEKICRAIKEGVGSPAKGILPPGIPGYDPNLAGYPYSPEKARELLKKSGYPNGEGLPEITLWHNRDPRHRLIGECVQYYLKQIGIRLKLKNVEWAAYLEACEEGIPLMYRMGWVADYPDADNFLYILLHSSQAGAPGNYSRYSNRKFDELVAKAQIISDPKERIRLYQAAEKIAVNDAVWLFVYYDQETALIKPCWNNVVLSPQGDFTIPLRLLTLKSD